MDHTTAFTIQDALDLLRAGKKAEAQSILLPVVRQDPDNAEAWYLLGFTFTDPQKRLDSFRQVLRIDPSNQAAQKQIAKLAAPTTTAHRAVTTQSQPFATPKPAPAFAANPIPVNPSQDSVKPKKPFPTELVISVVGVLVLLGAIAFYIGSGVNRNKQVDALFSERKCVEVAQQASFANSFPRAIFASFFSAYQQVEECQAKLALEHSVSVEDWPGAYTTIGNYLTAYPGGVFAEEMREQAGGIALSWAQSLVEKNDYGAAIQKLQLFLARYPASTDAPLVSKMVLDDYLLWAKYAYEQKNYEGAVQNLKTVSAHAQASPEQVQQANQSLVVVYVQWGKAEVASGALDEGLKHYDEAKTLDPNLADYDRLVNQANLFHADSLAAKGKFNEALAEVKAISDSAQSEESKPDAAAAQARIMDGYAHSKGLQAQEQMTAAATKACNKNKEPPELPIFALDTENIRFAFVVPFTVEPPEGWLANTPAELHYVLCLDESQATVQSCAYTGGHTLRRVRFTWALTVYDVVTGKSLKSTKLQGSAPPNCPARDIFTIGASTKDVYGTRPPVQKIIDWLASLKIKG